MGKFVYRLGFLRTLFFILAFLMMLVCASAEGQGGADEQTAEETAAAVVLQTEQATISPASPFPDADDTTAPTLPPNTLKRYLGSAVNTGRDNGFSGAKVIEANDPHFGWTLGRFFVSGHTRASDDADGNPVFIKTLGDTVTLWFSLEQDIDNLNGDDKLIISEDTNGYDLYFGINKTNFGRGTLIIRHIDYQNAAKEPTVYTDYLAAKAVIGADTEVELFEEGDYEAALNYEIKSTWANVLGLNIGDSYHNYRIFFRFSVRNGNCMVYPFDVITKAELTNSSVTENGFYLDLAKSRYLDINIKKEVLTDGANGLVEDTRFNRPAKDGDEYTEEGIYTIDVSNRYTGQQTTKQIYVGTNDVLKAHIMTGLSIQEIDEQIVLGARVQDDGVLVPVSSQQIATTPVDEISRISSLEAVTANAGNEPEDSPSNRVIGSIVVIVIVLFVALFIVFRKRGASKNGDVEAHNVDIGREDEGK